MTRRPTRNGTISARRAGERPYEDAFARSPVGLAVVDFDSGRVVEANEALAALLGRVREELRSLHVAELTAAPREAVDRFLRRELAERRAGTLGRAARVLRPDGDELWIDAAWASLDPGERPRLAVVVVHDVTAHRSAELALRASEERYRRLIEAANDGIWSVDAGGRVTFANATMARLLRTTPEELVGTPLSSWLFAADVSATEARLECRSRGQSERFEGRYRRADGSALRALVSATPLVAADGTYSGALKMVSDITELRRREAELARHAARQEIVAELGQLALSATNADAFLEEAAAAVAESLGAEYATVVELRPEDRVLALRTGYGMRERDLGAVIPFDSLTGAAIRGLASVVVEDVASDARFAPSPLMRSYNVVAGISCPIVVMDEPLGVLGVSTRAARAFDEAEVVFVRSVATLVGWTIRRERAERERRQAEEALRRSEERFRMLAENSADIVYRLRLQPEVAYEYVSPAAAAVVGHTPDEFYADPAIVARHVHPDDRELLASSIAAEGTIVVRWVREDGSVVHGERRARVIRDAGGRPVAVEGTIREVTGHVLAEQARAALEAQLLHAQKMEAVGRLAGGVAHDFNNLLTAITGYTDLLLDGGGLGDDALRNGLEIRAAATRAAALTRQLLAFGRRQVLQPEELDVSEVAAELEQMLGRLIGEDVRLEVRLADGLPPVLADRNSLSQVLMNLVVNARDAMPDGGTLRIETGEVELDGEYAAQHVGAAPGRYVLLAVTDTGVGMDETTQAQIFEPFFTTKAPGVGTGLGLSTVYGIVRQSGGSVWVYSEPGIGTTVKVYLPACSIAQPAPEPAPDPAPRSDRAGETVLLVEDEEIVRTLIGEILERSGYRVVVAVNGEEAVERFAAEDVDVLITDVVMPQLGGPELARRLRELRPGLRVLFTSGYASEAVDRQHVLAQESFLQKPFSSEALRLKLRELLDAAV